MCSFLKKLLFNSQGNIEYTIGNGAVPMGFGALPNVGNLVSRAVSQNRDQGGSNQRVPVSMQGRTLRNGGFYNQGRTFVDGVEVPNGSWGQ